MVFHKNPTSKFRLWASGTLGFRPEAKAFLDTSRLEGAQDALAAVVGILDQASSAGDR